jgi:hypothetical protein
LLLVDRNKFEKDHNTPVKTTTSGYRMGLSVLVRINAEEYYATNLASFGVKVSGGNHSKHFCGLFPFAEKLMNSKLKVRLFHCLNEKKLIYWQQTNFCKQASNKYLSPSSRN